MFRPSLSGVHAFRPMRLPWSPPPRAPCPGRLHHVDGAVGPAAGRSEATGYATRCERTEALKTRVSLLAMSATFRLAPDHLLLGEHVGDTWPTSAPSALARTRIVVAANTLPAREEAPAYAPAAPLIAARARPRRIGTPSTML